MTSFVAHDNDPVRIVCKNMLCPFGYFTSLSLPVHHQSSPTRPYKSKALASVKQICICRAIQRICKLNCTWKPFQIQATFEILNADFPDQISLDIRLVDSVSCKSGCFIGVSWWLTVILDFPFFRVYHGKKLKIFLYQLITLMTMSIFNSLSMLLHSAIYPRIDWLQNSNTRPNLITG